MSLKVVKDYFVQIASRTLKDLEIATQGDEVSLKLSHCILPQAPSAKADSLTKGAYPLSTIITMAKILFIISL